MAETIVVLGLSELRKALMVTVPLHFQGPILQKALLAGAKIVVSDAKARAPRLTGVLQRAIYSYRDRTGSRVGFESRLIGVKHGKKAQKGNRDAYYWRWIEFGRGEITVQNAKTLGTPQSGFFGKVVKAYPAHPFLRPAFESTKDRVIVAIKEKLADELMEAAKEAEWGEESNFSIGREAGSQIFEAVSSIAETASAFGEL